MAAARTHISYCTACAHLTLGTLTEPLAVDDQPLLIDDLVAVLLVDVMSVMLSLLLHHDD
jgi:hypothetical protein